MQEFVTPGLGAQVRRSIEDVLDHRLGTQVVDAVTEATREMSTRMNSQEEKLNQHVVTTTRGLDDLRTQPAKVLGLGERRSEFSDDTVLVKVDMRKAAERVDRRLLTAAVLAQGIYETAVAFLLTSLAASIYHVQRQGLGPRQ
jgi:hypothetical protein